MPTEVLNKTAVRDGTRALRASRLSGATLLGVDAFRVDVETQLSNALRKFLIVGLPDNALRESRERVRCAIENSGFTFPKCEVVVSLAPASLPKAGAGFDLAIALGILIADGQIPSVVFPQALLLGELALDGRVKGTEGALAAAVLARAEKGTPLIVAAENAAQAAAVEEVSVYGVQTLAEAAALLGGVSPKQPTQFIPLDRGRVRAHGVDFGDIIGQHAAKRALEIVAAGGHNVIFVGPPGAGKSLLARCLPTILPPLSREEAIEVTRIYSAHRLRERDGEAGAVLSARGVLMSERPFRAPHHTTSTAGLIGGGPMALPGEISYAHRGVLFLDELVEFRREALESLRQPLESREIVISRAKNRVVLPAAFILVAAMNPCPCGKRGLRDARCSCSPTKVESYIRKVSGPILDRIDLQLWIPPVSVTELGSRMNSDGTRGSEAPGMRERNETHEMSLRVAQARKRQRDRFQSTDLQNGGMRPREIREFCRVEPSVLKFLTEAARKLSLSARGYARVLKVSRTIADLAGSEEILLSHVSEALSYRLGPDLS